MKIQMNEEGKTKTQQLTVRLISDCPTVRVHAGKCFKALIDSGATIALMCTNVYNMIEDCYNTCIMPAVLNLWTADGSPMSSMGKANCHIQRADLKFLHTYVICDKTTIPLYKGKALF